jgi:hypothetical protein
MPCQRVSFGNASLLSAAFFLAPAAKIASNLSILARSACTKEAVWKSSIANFDAFELSGSNSIKAASGYFSLICKAISAAMHSARGQYTTKHSAM